MFSGEFIHESATANPLHTLFPVVRSAPMWVVVGGLTLVGLAVTVGRNNHRYHPASSPAVLPLLQPGRAHAPLLPCYPSSSATLCDVATARFSAPFSAVTRTLIPRSTSDDCSCSLVFTELLHSDGCVSESA